MSEPAAPDVTARVLQAMRDDWMQHVMPALQGSALEHAEYARQMLGRLCTDHTTQAADAGLQAEAVALFTMLDRALGETEPSDSVRTDATPGVLQQALLGRLRKMAVDPGVSDALWQRAARLAVRLRAAIEARSPALPVIDQSTAAVITAQALQRYLREHWPDAAQLEVPLLEVLPGGRSKMTMFARLAGVPQIDQIALRQDVANGMIDTIDGSTCVTNEWPVLQAAFAAGLPVAEPIWLEPQTTTLGAPFMLTRKLPGFTPGNWRGFHDPADPQTVSTVEHLAEVLGQLHSMDPRSSGLPLDAERSTEARVLREIAYRRDKWQREALSPFPLIDCAFERLRRDCQSGLGGPVLVHGDVLPHNLLAQNGRITALLDWEFAHLGDPAEDLAYCRGAVEAVMPWPDFMQRYQAAGGPAVDERRLSIFGLFALVRNSALLASAARLHAEGRIQDFTTGAIGYVSLPMMESLIGAQLQAMDLISNQWRPA